MQRVSPTPLRLVRRSLLGSAITLFGYCALFLHLPPPRFHHGFATLLWSQRVLFLVFVLPVLTGLTMIGLSHYRLGSGINRLRFTEDQVDQARAFVNQFWLTWLQVLMYAAVVICCSARFFMHLHMGDTAFILLLSANPLNYLRNALRRPRVERTSPRIDWGKVQPMRSDHWGDPPTPQTR